MFLVAQGGTDGVIVIESWDGIQVNAADSIEGGHSDSEFVALLRNGERANRRTKFQRAKDEYSRLGNVRRVTAH